jgi:hypothetical protein
MPRQLKYKKIEEFYYELLPKCMRTNLIEVCMYTFKNVYFSSIKIVTETRGPWDTYYVFLLKVFY